MINEHKGRSGAKDYHYLSKSNHKIHSSGPTKMQIESASTMNPYFKRGSVAVTKSPAVSDI